MNDKPLPVVYLRRNRATADQIEQILGLPDNRWGDVQIRFGNDGLAVATVDLFIDGDQLQALAQLAIQVPEQP